MHITLVEVASILGMLFGTAGLVMSIMNYLRDRPKVQVTLRWEMTEMLTDKPFGIVRVTNVGRRPIYISVAALQLPKGFKHSHRILKQSMSGQKLSEGDAPATFLVQYDDLQQYSRKWREIRAYAEDSAGIKYVPDKVPESPIPSWVKYPARPA
jgi:hypothetical protein